MNVAVLGLGFMGVTHSRAWQRIPGAKLCAVVTRKDEAVSGVIAEVEGNLGRSQTPLDLTGIRRYRSPQEALEDPLIDAVDICLPTDLHATTAIEALRSGKHVLVEKPLALSASDADRVVREAEGSGRVLMVAQVLRFMPAYVAARERVPRMAHIRSASFRRRCAAPGWSEWLSNPARSGGGAFDLLIHDADFARALFGMPSAVSSTRALDNDRGLDVLTATLDYGNFVVTISGGWYLTGAYPFSMEFTIAGEDSVLEFNSWTGALVRYSRETTPETLPIGSADPFEAELTHFRDCAERGEFSPICPPHESADAVRLMEMILAAAR